VFFALFALNLSISNCFASFGFSLVYFVSTVAVAYSSALPVTNLAELCYLAYCDFFRHFCSICTVSALLELSYLIFCTVWVFTSSALYYVFTIFVLFGLFWLIWGYLLFCALLTLFGLFCALWDLHTLTFHMLTSISLIPQINYICCDEPVPCIIFMVFCPEITNPNETDRRNNCLILPQLGKVSSSRAGPGHVLDTFTSVVLRWPDGRAMK